MSTDTIQTGEPAEAKTVTEQAIEKKESDKARDELLRDMQALKPMVDDKTYVFGKDETARAYTQKPLGFMGKMEFFSVIGSAIDAAMSGENAMTLNSILAGFNISNERKLRDLTAQDFMDADAIILGVSKLMIYAPNLLLDLYCIFLNVPRNERVLAKELMLRSPNDGGMTDEVGYEIIDRFLDQNVEAIESFFTEKLPEFSLRARAKMKKYKKLSAPAA